MKPLNKEERRKAFFNFLMFFMITIGVIITTVSFGVYVLPAKENSQLQQENNQLQQEINKLKKERNLATSFTNKMAEIIRLFDSLNKEVKSPELIEGEITQNLDSMDKMINDSMSTIDLYEYAVNTFRELKDAKKQIRNAKINNSSAEECQNRIMELQNERDQWKTKYDDKAEALIDCKTNHQNYVNQHP